MKSMIIILLGLIITRHAPENETQEYFYFGNTNLIGVGPAEEGKKFGTWKIYKRMEVLDAPQVSLEEVRGVEVAELFDLSIPVYQINFKENLPDGLMEEFFPGGQIKKLLNFSQGKLNGDFFEYNESGEAIFSGSYLDDLKEGDWNSNYPNGSPKSEYSYAKNLLQGTTKNYYPDGRLAEMIPFESGKLRGTYKAFFSNGAVQKSMDFENDQEHGFYKRFFDDGQLEISGSFARGQLDGGWENFNNLGDLISRGMYKAGIRIGTWEEQIPEVQGFYRVGAYQAGNKTGTWQVVDLAGIMYQEEQFSEDRLVAFSEFKTPDGKILGAGKLTNGTGRRLIFDHEGNLLEKGRYRKGVRSGAWFTYYPKSDALASKGSYTEGEKTGTWRYYGMKGESLGEENFESGNPSLPREAASSENHNMPRNDFGRNRVAEPESSNDMRFLERFKRPNVPRFEN